MACTWWWPIRTHNRVLIWNRIPASNDIPADVAVGQPDLVTGTSLPNNLPPTASSMRGPQGVWIQNGKLYVADTQNNRILIWNHIPTANGTAADVVLGQPNFTTYRRAGPYPDSHQRLRQHHA